MKQNPESPATEQSVVRKPRSGRSKAVVRKVAKPTARSMLLETAAELAEAAEKHTLAVTPLIGVRPRDLLGAAGRR